MTTKRSTPATLASVLAGAVLAVWASAASAQGTGRQEAERRRILDQLGLEKKDKAPAPPGEKAPSENDEGGAAAEPEGAPAPGAAPAAPPPPPPFKGRVHQLLLTSCRACHGAGGPAAATRLVLDGNAERDHAATRKLVDLRNPRRSVLLTKATGNQHAGGPTLAAGSEPYRRLLGWISGGAVFAAETAPASGAAPAPPAVSSGSGGARRARRPASPATAAAPSSEAATPVPPPEPPATPPEPSAAAGEPPPAPGVPPPSAVPAPSMPAVAINVHAALARSCRSCHAPSATAGMTRFLLTGEIGKDLAMSRGFVTASDPPSSAIATKAAGKLHGGGAPWPEGHPDRATLLAWISAGAPAAPPVPGADAPAPPPVATADAATAAVLPPTPVAPPPVHGVAGHPGGSPLAVSFWGQTLTLNGRFDLNYERRQFQNNPFSDGAVNALQSYHHFLFLTRTSNDDPFTFTAEIVNLELFEMAARLTPRRAPCYLNIRAGKLLVPFGAEPLFHQSYGGHLGFDQRVLPAIWTSEAVALTGGARVRGISLHGDLFAMKGYELRREDAVLNLKADFSPVDQARIAFGGRLGLAIGPLSAYYSALGNRLGFDRVLFLQALDVSLWRLREVPVLDRFVLAAGFLRGDVSGGGAGNDYYHLASYWLARAYLFDWLSVQYRQGMRMLGNRRGFLGDETRLGPEDGSTHNFSIIARHHGLQVILAYYFNLEKAGEIDDDLLRLQVAYEF